MQFYEDMKLEVIAAIPMTDQEGDKPKAKQTEAAAKRGSLMTALNCVVWDTNGPGYLSEFNLDTATANQKHPNMSHTTENFRASKSYATEVHFYEQQMCS